MNTPALTTDEQVLAVATREAIRAAGGLEVCARETGLSTSQLSRCSSSVHRDSITVRDAARIEAIGHGSPGHPQRLRALARMLGGVFVMLPEANCEGSGLPTSVMEMAAELGDVSRAIQDGLSSHGPDGTKMTPAEARVALEQLHDHETATARLRVALEAIAEETAARD